MTPKELATVIFKREPRLGAHFICQVLLALKRLLKEASAKDREEILRAISATRNDIKKICPPA